MRIVVVHDACHAIGSTDRLIVLVENRVSITRPRGFMSLTLADAELGHAVA